MQTFIHVAPMAEHDSAIISQFERPFFPQRLGATAPANPAHRRRSTRLKSIPVLAILSLGSDAPALAGQPPSRRSAATKPH